MEHEVPTLNPKADLTMTDMNMKGRDPKKIRTDDRLGLHILTTLTGKRPCFRVWIFELLAS